MGSFHRMWNWLTSAKALQQSSGSYENMFFESVYTFTILAGFSRSNNILYLIYSYILKLFIILLLYCEFWYFFTLTKNLDGIIGSINIIIIQLSAMYKYKKLISHEDIFKELASSMESPYFDLSTPERKKLLDVWQKRNKAYLVLILFLGIGTLIVWYIYPLVDDLDYNLMVAVRLPFDYYSRIRYILTYIGVLIVFSYIAFFVMVNDLIMQAHVMNILCQLTVLNDCFRNILQDCCENPQDLNHNLLFTADGFKQMYLKKFDDLIKQHQLILKTTLSRTNIMVRDVDIIFGICILFNIYVTTETRGHIWSTSTFNVLELRAILSGPMLAQLSVSTTLICSIGYQVATNTDNYTKCLMSLLYLGYNMSVLYIICRWCEEVKIQSEDIGEAVYFSGWERGIASVPGVRARLLFVIARANKPLVLSAGGMYDLSLASYANMIKTSYSALTLLLRLRHE